jgi:hypothetical protein
MFKQFGHAHLLFGQESGHDIEPVRAAGYSAGKSTAVEEGPLVWRVVGRAECRVAVGKPAEAADDFSTC